MDQQPIKQVESIEDEDKEIAEYADAVKWFIDHPEAELEPVYRACIDEIKRIIEEDAIAAKNPQKKLEVI